MAVAFLGFTFLIAALFPVGEQLAPLLLGGLFRGALKGTPAVFLHLLVLALSYLPAAAATSWFFRKAHLSRRPPASVPGTSLMAAGVALMLFFVAARLLASTVEGGGGAYVVMSFAPFVVWPARIALAIGACKLLLAVVPSNMSFQPTASGGR